MPTLDAESPFLALELPREFTDIESMVHEEIAVIVSMLTEHARQRLLLTRRGYQGLQEELWNGLTAVVNQAMEPLTAENR